MKHQEVEQKAEEAILACLEEVPFVEVLQTEREVLRGTVRPDLLVDLSLPDGERSIVVEVKSSGEPRTIRDGINQLLRYREFFPYGYGVLVAPYMSPQSAEICAQEGVGYVDLAGNCRLSFGQVFIQREGRANRFAKKRDLRSLYSPKAERVLRVLMNKPGNKWKMQQMAAEAGVSLGQVANVKRLLLDREWIQVDRDGFSVSKPDLLLEQWSQNYNFRRNKVHDFYSLRTVGEVEKDLADACHKTAINHAFTGFSGAARVAPFVRYLRATAYVDDDVEKLASLVNLKQVGSGANVSLWEPYDEGVFYGAKDIDGVRVVAPVQLYLDLKGFRGRGEEAANFLLKEGIKPQ